MRYLWIRFIKASLKHGINENNLRHHLSDIFQSVSIISRFFFFVFDILFIEILIN